ncbi:HNH endonuclease [Ruminococcus flavefaciens]|uniref:HNH endonuclease n=1 Tax=Ruminococcus flavefaciens TaxID=1265 RepID=UPI0009E84AE8
MIGINRYPRSFEELYCHHIIPLSKGGTDGFDNMVIIHKDIHTLIHAWDEYEILEILSQIRFTKSQLKKFNKLRKAAGYTTI